MVMFVGHFGWQPGLLVISAFLLLPLPGILLYREQPVNPAQTLTLRDVTAFFRQPHAGRWLLVVATMPIGAALMAPAVELLLVDRGYKLAEIGLVMGVLTGLAGATGGIVGGITVKKFGRERAFYALTIFCSVCLGMVLLSGVATGRFLLYLVISFPALGLMARATMLHALMMDRCRAHVASTDFTIQYTLQHVSRLLWMSAGAFVAGRFGPTTVFVLGPLLTIGALIAASRLLDSSDFQVAFHQRDNPPHDQPDAPKREESLAA
jgi:PAT family beta-lactamase induction signal transducer AmpG